MEIAPQTLETLEFPKICAQLARHTAFSASRELALNLLPGTDPYEVRRQLALTSEARDLLAEHPEITIGGVRDVRPLAGHAARGGTLEGGALLEVAGTLAGMRRLRTTLLKQPAGRYPQLADYAVTLPELPALEENITRAIADDGSVLDHASPELARLRREVRIAFDRLQEKLQNMISASQYAEALQEPIITVRNGRYVIPVKASHRRVVRGLVHDQSGSGATLYIEPMAIVDLNNRWRELQAAEEEEVARILAALSGLVGQQARPLILGVETTALIDLAFARAKYAEALRCSAPEIVTVDPSTALSAGGGRWTVDGSLLPEGEPPLRLNSARHPLLDQQKVVPIDLYLGGNFRILLITGPNTGGKTVALKTTGLLALMAQAGLHIPAAHPSRLPVFGRIFADIGDEQSIEQSLSTFSSHMTNIIRILHALDETVDGEPFDFAVREPGERQGRLWTDPSSSTATAHDSPSTVHRLPSTDHRPSLVLLDELGAGTDPVEGAALARAISERLLEMGCLAVATTHYAELKAFAYATAYVQNASVEFDVETLAPTYRLSIGLPGRSNALAIAARLGLDEALIERAHATIDRDEARVEDLLAGIHRERETIAAELRRAEELRTDAEKYRERLNRELHEFEDSRQARAEQARNELEEELREVRSLLRRMRDEFRSVSISRQWMEEAEQRLQEAQAQVKQAAEKTRPAPVARPAEQAPRPLQVGDNVYVRSVRLNGEIVTIDEEDQAADVQVGGFRMRVALDELRREKGRPAEDRTAGRRPAPERTVSLPAAPEVSMSFDMRGWRAAEVADKLDRYLNEAYLAGLPQVRLIHGKGTGALRQVVRDVLQSHPLVASFGGGGADGGDGVTVAKMVER